MAVALQDPSAMRADIEAGCLADLEAEPAMMLQVMAAVDLYCGCGGLSFVDTKTDQVHIKTQWAVDNEESACCSFRANYPDAAVSNRARSS